MPRLPAREIGKKSPRAEREREGGRAKGAKGGRKGAGTLGETMVVALEGVRVLART